MRWPKRDVFHAALSVFSDDRVAFSHVCAMNMIARTEGRRKASDGRPLNLNFGPLSCLNSHFCLQGENFSLSPFICIKEKNTFQYYLVFSQVSVHASLSVSMCVAYFAYYGHLKKKKNSSCHPVEIPYVCYCLCSMEVRTWEIQLDLWKQLAFLMCVSSRYCVCVKMYTMWWILQFLWFGQPKPRTLRGRNAAQSDYLTVFMHHECVHYEKKKAKLHFGFAIKALYFFLNEGLELNHSSQSLHALCSCLGALSAHICFLYTWSWLQRGAEPALITLESPPGRGRASRLTR